MLHEKNMKILLTDFFCKNKVGFNINKIVTRFYIRAINSRYGKQSMINLVFFLGFWLVDKENVPDNVNVESEQKSEESEKGIETEEINKESDNSNFSAESYNISDLFSKID